MEKPKILRKKLCEYIPFFQENPDRLSLYFSNGTLTATGAKLNLSYEKSYDLEVFAEDVIIDPDLFFFIALEFVKEQQSELLFNDNNHGKIEFEAESLNNDSFDIYLKIPLTERVIVEPRDNGYNLTYTKEPSIDEFAKWCEEQNQQDKRQW